MVILVRTLHVQPRRGPDVLHAPLQRPELRRHKLGLRRLRRLRLRLPLRLARRGRGLRPSKLRC